MTLSRRDLLATLAAVPLAVVAPAPRRDRVVLLGTKGGPTPSPLRAAPATLIQVGGRGHVIDCGNGVARQLAAAGFALPDLTRIYVTHHHSDHIADVVTLPLLAWASGLNTPVGIHGPPPLRRTVAAGLAAARADIAARIREEKRVPLTPLLRVFEHDRAGPVWQGEGMRVTTALVDHYTVRPALAYRFDTPARSIVISGDTTYSPALVALARGADLLIHECFYLPAVERMAGENAPGLRDHLIRSHATPQQAGRVAAEAGVKKLVLSHLVPAFPDITDAMWLAGVRRHYAGEAVVGRDLMEV